MPTKHVCVCVCVGGCVCGCVCLCVCVWGCDGVNKGIEGDRRNTSRKNVGGPGPSVCVCVCGTWVHVFLCVCVFVFYYFTTSLELSPLVQIHLKTHISPSRVCLYIYNSPTVSAVKNWTCVKNAFYERNWDFQGSNENIYISFISVCSVQDRIRSAFSLA